MIQQPRSLQPIVRRVFTTGIRELLPALRAWSEQWEWKDYYGRIELKFNGPNIEVFCEKNRGALARRLEGAESYWLFLFHREDVDAALNEARYQPNAKLSHAAPTQPPTQQTHE